jgi:pimeloyl-ACP methyl ester carboxylesterase
LLLLHGFTDTWRTWELVLPVLEREHEVMALTLAGHAGGPSLDGDVTEELLADEIERALDAAGWDRPDVAGNSLGGYLALLLASRGRARSVVALAPAGGWAEGDKAIGETHDHFVTMQELLKQAAPHADAIVASPEGRRRASFYMATNYEHIPGELLAHMMVGAASCPAVFPLIEHSKTHGWPLDASKIDCPVRIVWGTGDKILEWPGAAARYREALPQADWVELDGIGHGPQLDVPLETAQLILDFTR